MLSIEQVRSFQWLPPVMIWLSFILGMSLSQLPSLHSSQMLSIVIGLFNVTAIAAGIFLLIEAIYYRNFIAPLAIYLVGFSLCLTFLTH